jgi:hypothetical protein
MAQLAIIALLPNSWPIVGRARLMELPIKVVMKDVVITVYNVVLSADVSPTIINAPYLSIICYYTNH